MNKYMNKYAKYLLLYLIKNESRTLGCISLSLH